MNIFTIGIPGSLIFLEFSAKGVIMAGVVVGATGILIGLLLGIAAKKFAVKTDERVEKVRELLLGSNCGGCGFAGCDACAEAIVKGEASVGACAGADASKIAEVMGVSADAQEKKVAFVKCSGTCDKTEVKYRYHGLSDCRKISLVPGKGEKVCNFGCMGYGSCVKVCRYDAIHVVDGVAKVDRSKCIGCGACTKVCPNGVIELIPVSAPYMVGCVTKLKGKDVKAACEVGCLGCGICAKQCENGAIEVVDGAAKIDTSKCIGCGKCAEKCPRKIITMTKQ